MATLNPPPLNDPLTSQTFTYWFEKIRTQIDIQNAHNSLASIQGGSSTERFHLTSAQHSGLTGLTISASGDTIVLPTYTVAGVPAVGANARALIYVSDETGGATVAFSDGTNWRRVQDRAIIA